uniref:Cytochrome c oxidase subunit 3 n=1 Tax=Loxosomella aloxiata TaxID=393182 RepID=B1B1X2_9BILA|nr:cytochrome c oxidase subunit III [Loxosomella aloxiata]BAG12598.1 cytochrome oxidase subunit III [Loxosomella aloxiata]
MTFNSVISCFFLTSGSVGYFHNFYSTGMVVGFLLILLTMVVWWRDVIREASFQGFHSYQVTRGLRWGMILFIISEVCFFFAFFWAYFHSSLSPTMELGSCWPSVGIHVLNPFQVPLLNTAVLLSSGVSVTWAHHAAIEGIHSNWNGLIQGLIVTVFLGIYFTVLQAGEYYEVSFAISDSVYGSVFFMATGFHGFHVLIGTAFLTVCLFRAMNQHFSTGHHFGLEAAIWYWHFVDVVWLFLYISVYWWAS